MMRPFFTGTLLALASLPAVTSLEESYLKGNASYWRAFLPGVIRPEAGTIEVVVRPEKPMAEFGNNWDFAFMIPPARDIGTGANTLVGIYAPPLPETGAIALMRTGKHAYRATVPNLAFEPGKNLILAISWGREFTFAVNGKVLARASMKDFPPLSLWPDHLRMAKYGPWNPKAIRISTEARAEGDLASDPEKDFARDADTSLLANDLTAPSQTFQTGWHGQTFPLWAQPAFRPEKQSLRPGDPVVFPVVTMNRGNRSRSVTVQVQATSLTSGASKTFSFPFDIAANTAASVRECSLSGLSTPDFHQILWKITGEGMADLSGKCATAIFPKDRDAPEGPLSRYYGVHQEDSFHPSTFRAIDARTSRAWAGGTVFLWRTIEPTEGQFRFDEAEAYVKECTKAGMDVLGVLGYPSRWASADPGEAHRAKGGYLARPDRWKPASLEAWGRYVRRTVERFKGRVKYWEIYNEVNFHPPGLAASFSGTTEDYLDLIRVAWREAKAADPACQILSSGFSTEAEPTMPIAFTKQGGARYCDIFNLHGYGGVEACAPILAPFRKEKPDAPVWMTEQMWHELSDLNKRVYLAVAWPLFYLEKGYARFLNMGVREVFFDRTTFSPTLDQWAIGVLQNELFSAENFIGRLSFEGQERFDLRHQIRRTDGATLTVLGSETGTFEVETPTPILRARDLFGRPIPLRTVGSANRFLITNLAYVVSKTPLAISKALAKSKMTLLVNGQFEEVDGDIGMAGLASGKPRHYVLRDKTYDKEGTIHLSETAKSGRFGISVTSSGAGRVYLVQYAGVPEKGTYVVRGHFRRMSGDAKPYLFLFDQDRNKVFQAAMEQPGNEFLPLELKVPFEGKNVKPLGLGWGILSGSGEVVVDDVSFDPMSPEFDSAHFVPIPLGATANLAPVASEKENGFNRLAGTYLPEPITGDRVHAGLSFRIGGPKETCMLILDPKNPGRPAVIPVGAPLKGLAFLHTALYVKAKAGETLGQYRVHYQDGSQVIVPILHRSNIDDWYSSALETPAPVGEAMPAADRHDRILYAWRWVNPNPEKVILHISVTGSENATLVLAALSGEKP